MSIFKVNEMLQCFLIKKDITSNVNMSHEKMSNFGSFLLLGFTLVTKPRNCDFESHWNILILFYKKKMWDLTMSYVHCLIWFIHILGISWEIQIFKFYWNSLILFNSGICFRSKFVPFFCLICIFWNSYRNSLELKKFLMTLRYIKELHWNFCI